MADDMDRVVFRRGHTATFGVHRPAPLGGPAEFTIPTAHAERVRFEASQRYIETEDWIQEVAFPYHDLETAIRMTIADLDEEVYYVEQVDVGSRGRCGSGSAFGRRSPTHAASTPTFHNECKRHTIPRQLPLA